MAEKFKPVKIEDLGWSADQRAKMVDVARMVDRPLSLTQLADILAIEPEEAPQEKD